MTSPESIIVVGGGLAGLAAAHHLTRYGRCVLVLEAADVIGGRIKQCSVGHSTNSTLAEAGAEFFHGHTSTSKKLADAIGLETERVFSTAHGDGGPDEKPAPDGSIGLFFTADGERFNFDSQDAGFVRLNEALDKLCEELSEPNSLPVSDQRSLQQYLVDEGVSPKFVELAVASYANTVGVGTAMDKLPLRQVARLERLWGVDGDGDYRVCSPHMSLSTLCHSLTHGSQVWCNAVVTSIEVFEEQNDAAARVRVTCADGRVHHAAASIVAAPVTVLQRGSIRFVPALPADKLRALRSIRMGNACKIMLLFRKPPWAAAPSANPRVHSIISAGLPGRVVPEVWFKNIPDGSWFVSGFATGTYADALGALGEAAASDLLLLQLARSFPAAMSLESLRALLVASRLVDWSKEPYVGGGYSSPSFDEHEQDRALYRRPEWNGLLCFCGEATEDACMTMSAALESGKRAASELQQALLTARARPPAGALTKPTGAVRGGTAVVAGCGSRSDLTSRL